MSAVAHERQFGVEIECGFSGGDYTEIRHRMKEAGFPMSNPRNRPLHSRYSVGRDGSGVEVRTPILKGKRGFNELRRIFFFLNEQGCYTGQNDGMHVHHDAPELVRNPLLTRNLVRSWVANRDAICEMVTPYRRRRMGPWDERSLAMLDAYGRGETWIVNEYGNRRPICFPTFNRKELNIASLPEHGTIEFRLHEGTLNIDDAIAWIKFGQRFMDSTLHRARPLRKGNREQLLNRIRLSKTEQAKLDNKRRRISGIA